MMGKASTRLSANSSHLFSCMRHVHEARCNSSVGDASIAATLATRMDTCAQRQTRCCHWATAKAKCSRFPAATPKSNINQRYSQAGCGLLLVCLLAFATRAAWRGRAAHSAAKADPADSKHGALPTPARVRLAPSSASPPFTLQNAALPGQHSSLLSPLLEEDAGTESEG